MHVNMNGFLFRGWTGLAWPMPLHPDHPGASARASGMQNAFCMPEPGAQSPMSGFVRHLSSAECATSRSGQRGVGSGSSRRRPFRPTATPSAERAACSATLDSSLVPASSAPAQRSRLPLKQRSCAHGVADLPARASYRAMAALLHIASIP